MTELKGVKRVVFEGLANRLQETFRRLKGKGKLSVEDVNEAMRKSGWPSWKQMPISKW